MAAKLPTDLSYAWWKANKATTLKPTGFGDALKKFAAAEATFGGLKQPSFKDFDAVLAAGENLLNVRKKAESACLPKLHDDTKAALKHYEKLMLPAFSKYTNRRGAYEGRLHELAAAAKDALKEAETLGKQLMPMDKNYDGLEKVATLLKKTPDQAKKVTALKLAAKFNGEVEEVEKKLKKAYEELDKKVSQSHLGSEDMYTIASMKQFNNKYTGISQLMIPPLKKRYNQIKAALG